MRHTQANEIVMETHRDPSIIDLSRNIGTIINYAESLESQLDAVEDRLSGSKNQVPRGLYNSLLYNFQRIKKERDDWRSIAQEYKYRYEMLKDATEAEPH